MRARGTPTIALARDDGMRSAEDRVRPVEWIPSATALSFFAIFQVLRAEPRPVDHVRVSRSDPGELMQTKSGLLRPRSLSPLPPPNNRTTARSSAATGSAD